MQGTSRQDSGFSGGETCDVFDFRITAFDKVIQSWECIAESDPDAARLKQVRRKERVCERGQLVKGKPLWKRLRLAKEARDKSLRAFESRKEELQPIRVVVASERDTRSMPSRQNDLPRARAPKLCAVAPVCDLA